LEPQQTTTTIVYELLRDRIEETKLTTVVGFVGDKMINALKRGEVFTFYGQQCGRCTYFTGVQRF